MSLSVTLWTRKESSTGYRGVDKLNHWRLLPESTAQPQPDFVPQPLRDDYYEACRIVDLSPKASATLARRCLQGMIRDFCAISKNRLIDEIDELRDRIAQGHAPAGVTIESVEAIDHVRSIGNIGAHMERDINVVIDVDPGEAEALIRLIELLFEEWYIARNSRRERLAAVSAIAEQKRHALEGGGGSDRGKQSSNEHAGDTVGQPPTQTP